MIGFIAGFFTGGFFGVVLMCILAAAGRSDDSQENISDDLEKNTTVNMFQRLTDRGDVDKEHIIELESGKAKLFFLKESKNDNALVRVKNLLLDSYEQRVQDN